MSRYTQTEPGLAEFFLVAIAVFIGALGAMLVHDEITVYRLKVAATEINTEFKKELARQEQKDQQRRLAVQKQKLEQEWEQQKRSMAAAQQTAEARARAQRKEQAWEQFYQPTGVCKIDSARGDCADQHIRARAIFNAQYKDPYD